MPERGSKMAPLRAIGLAAALFAAFVLLHYCGTQLILHGKLVLLGVTVWVISFVLLAAFLVVAIIFWPWPSKRK